MSVVNGNDIETSDSQDEEALKDPLSPKTSYRKLKIGFVIFFFVLSCLFLGTIFAWRYLSLRYGINVVGEEFVDLYPHSIILGDYPAVQFPFFSPEIICIKPFCSSLTVKSVFREIKSKIPTPPRELILFPKTLPSYREKFYYQINLEKHELNTREPENITVIWLISVGIEQYGPFVPLTLNRTFQLHFQEL